MGCSNSKLTADVVSPLPASTAPLVAAGKLVDNSLLLLVVVVVVVIVEDSHTTAI